jgi:predicted Na+-dependent transporter
VPKAVAKAGVPVLVLFLTIVVGVARTTAAYRRVARRPGTIAAATVGLLVLLPVSGWLLAGCLKLQSAVVPGVLLVAARPGGARVNVCTCLPRANGALSAADATVPG